MDKQTLSNYGWVIITVLVLAVMIALATPFGSYIKEGAKSTLTGLFESSENALNTGLGEAGVSVNKAEFGGVPTVGGNSVAKCCATPNITTYGDDTKCENCGTITYGSEIHNGLIPEGAVYYVREWVTDGELYDCSGCSHEIYDGAFGENNSCAWCCGNCGLMTTNKLTAGQPFPTANGYDMYEYKNCKYTQSPRWTPELGAVMTTAGYVNNRWMLDVDDASAISNAISEINGMPADCWDGLFARCSDIPETIVIPEFVKSINGMFWCRSGFKITMIFEGIVEEYEYFYESVPDVEIEVIFKKESFPIL